MWPGFLAIYFQFTFLKFEERPNSLRPRDYTNALKNAVVIATSALTVLFQMMEFRIKYLTVPFILALSLNLFIFLHTPELIALMFHLQGI